MIYIAKIIVTSLLLGIASGVLFSYTHAASVIISEIAWMGTSLSANHEWIELHNISGQDIDLTGWSLVSVGAAPTILLQGILPARGFFLLERTSDATVPGIPADIIYTGALSNTGAYLQLRDSDQNIIDAVNNSDGWQGGDNTTKDTMQKVNGVWGTGTPTPKALNIHTVSSSSSGDTPSGSAAHSGTTTGQIASAPVNHTQSSFVLKDAPIQKPDFYIDISIPSHGFQGVPLDMHGMAYQEINKEGMWRGYYVWHMGDGHVYTRTPKHIDDFMITHTYAHAGTYIVALEYRTNNFDAKQPTFLRTQSITIHKHPVSIEAIDYDGSVSIENHHTEMIDLEGWSVSVHGYTHIFPKYAFVAPHALVTIPLQLPAGYVTHAVLRDPAGGIAYVYRELDKTLQEEVPARTTAVVHQGDTAPASDVAILGGQSIFEPHAQESRLIMQSSQARNAAPTSKKAPIAALWISIALGVLLLGIAVYRIAVRI
ncbi:MAG: lamin tail domain-containing protein [Candidatus Pacebacteria bacterium]|nr:lamin tail domain-containing protein [Candidatus Paceibacterota bacterium]MCD8563634.1 lamin tail domain-containing protein [Candidatus Paceibacterota bacterium]